MTYVATPFEPLQQETGDRDALLAELLEDLTRRLRRGERPDIAQVAAKHPELADELKSLWAAVQIAEELSQPIGLATTQWAGQPGTGPAVSSIRGSSFGDYELEAELGRGGMGVVYKARQKSLGRTVALKMILNSDLASPADRERIRNEAQAVAKLDHPGIVPVYEIGEHEGRPFFTMKYIDGPTLSELVAQNPLPSRQAAQYVLQVAEAVHHAHQCGILHRDLKPSNILLSVVGRPLSVDRPAGSGVDNGQRATDDEQAQVTDFGLARRMDGASSLTQAGAILGTPSYMAPEQAAGRRGQLTPAADVYSLGAVLYHLLAGRPPFLAPSPADILIQVLEQDPVPPRLLNPAVDRDLEMICLKCLQKPIELRYATAADLAADLRAYLQGEPISIRPGSLAYLMSRVFRPTHHAAVLENWGLLWMMHSVKVLIQCGLTAWLAWEGVTGRLPYLMLWGVALLLWSWIFWTIRKRSGPVTFVERQVAHVWGAAVNSSILLFFVEMIMGLPVLTLSPVLALVAGIIFMVKAGTLSGAFYVASGACFITALVMAYLPTLWPRDGQALAILLFGVVVAASFFIPGLKYYLQRRAARVPRL